MSGERGGEMKLKRLRDRFKESGAELAAAVTEAFPVGQRCAIKRMRRDTPFQIRGVVASTPWSCSHPTELMIRTDKRGTIMRADYQDVVLL